MSEGLGLNDIKALPGRVLLEFTGQNCPACVKAAPVVEKVAREMGITLLVVDVGRMDPIVREIGVKGLPTFALFEDGVQVRRWSGYVGEARFRSQLDGR